MNPTKYLIPWHKPDLNRNDLDYIIEAFESGWISNGSFVKELESQICQYTGSKYALAVCNGTAALHLAFWGINLQAGDEVIVPAFTFIGPASIAKIMGATVKSADICPKTWCIDPDSVRKVITNKTKAIVAVHVYGNVSNMDELLKISAETGIPIIEDAAESFGSRYGAKYAGAIGKLGIYSFHATKNITTGEGGMVLTDDESLYEQMYALREHGMKQRKAYWHEYAGHNFRLTNLQAALGCSQLKKFNEIIEAKRKIHETYLECVKDSQYFESQTFQPNVHPVLWVFAVLLKSTLNVSFTRSKRDEILKSLENDGIECRPGFFPLNLLPPFLGQVEECSHSSFVSERIIVLPTFNQITTNEIRHICDRLLFHIERISNEI